MYDIDVAAQNEVCFPDTVAVERMAATIVWSRKLSCIKCEAGVALAISNNLTLKLDQDPKPVSDRILTLRLPLTDEHNCTMVATYEPNMTNSSKTIDTFYIHLYQVLGAIAQF